MELSDERRCETCGRGVYCKDMHDLSITTYLFYSPIERIGGKFYQVTNIFFKLLILKNVGYWKVICGWLLGLLLISCTDSALELYRRSVL